MRYIKHRSNYLVDYKRTGMIQSQDFGKINEEAPFESDIAWGDSLLGRLINSTIRKAKIGINLKRMDKVIDRLKDAFEELYSRSLINNEASEDEKKEINRILELSFLDELKKSIESGDDLDIILNLTISTIGNIESSGEFEGKDQLIDQLNGFRKFLENQKELEDDESDQDKSDEVEKKQSVSFSTSMKTNFGLVYQILCEYNSLLSSGTVSKVSKPSQIESDADKEKNKTLEKPGVSNVGVVKQNSSYEIENIFESVTNMEPAFVSAIKPLHSYFKSKGFKFPSDFDGRNNEFLRLLDSNKDSILKVYKSILLIKENQLVDLLLRPEDLAKHIFNLYKFTKSKSSGEIKGFEKAKSYVFEFNKTMEEILKMKQVTPKKESVVVSYFEFIKEADESKDEDSKKEFDDKESESSDINEKIKEYFFKNVDIKKYTLEKGEILEIKKKIDDFEKKKPTSLTLEQDPVIEIVKIFNRAFKLHTTQVIPSGREGGKVSNKTFMEYTCFGEGTPSSAGVSGGPYRNNNLFDKWEDAVLNIMREKKYQPIFNTETKIKVGNEYIDKAGANLRKFMSDMLVDVKLYNIGRDGNSLQAKLLDEYFGYKSTDKDGKDITHGNDAGVNSPIAKEVSEKEKTIEFTNVPIKYGKVSDLKYSFFCFEKDEKSRNYFFIQDIDGGDAYVIWSQTFGFFKDLIERTGVSLKVKQGKLKKVPGNSKTKSDGSEYELRAFKAPLSKLVSDDGKSPINGEKVIDYLLRFEGNKNKSKGDAVLKNEKVELSQFFTLRVLESEVETEVRRFVIDSSKSEIIKANTTWSDIKTNPQIAKTGIK
jgi:hypothetical protein